MIYVDIIFIASFFFTSGSSLKLDADVQFALLDIRDGDYIYPVAGPSLIYVFDNSDVNFGVNLGLGYKMANNNYVEGRYTIVLCDICDNIYDITIGHRFEIGGSGYNRGRRRR